MFLGVSLHCSSAKICGEVQNSWQQTLKTSVSHKLIIWGCTPGGGLFPRDLQALVELMLSSIIIIIIIIIIINEKINVAFSRRTARTRNSHKKHKLRKRRV